MEKISGSPGSDVAQEYRVEELARAAGITTRTLRFYRERKLLGPPRKEGRIAWYGAEHLERLRVIGELLERGHTLGGIAELIGAGESGQDVAELIGLQAAITAPWSDETPVHLSWTELADAFGDQLTDANTAESVAQGYITVEDDGITHVSRRLMEATTALIAEGVPLAAVLAASRKAQDYADAVAGVFTTLIRDELLGALTHAEELPPAEATRLTDLIQRVRPLARTVADAQFALAMDRRVMAEYGSFVDEHSLCQERPGQPADQPAGGTPGGGRPVA
ncbi:MerR family transcriptional regulator [Kitasatospora sp. McL0602]|uniref:MerR family transcriptional regulator n=1 Tax=Kitasatospora sp. McL0602 TaxID=3439530 RepID=UPI003F8BF767